MVKYYSLLVFCFLTFFSNAQLDITKRKHRFGYSINWIKKAKRVRRIEYTPRVSLSERDEQGRGEELEKKKGKEINFKEEDCTINGLENLREEEDSISLNYLNARRVEEGKVQCRMHFEKDRSYGFIIPKGAGRNVKTYYKTNKDVHNSRTVTHRALGKVGLIFGVLAVLNIVAVFALNLFFFQGLVLLAVPGYILSRISWRKEKNTYAKWGSILNLVAVGFYVLLFIVGIILIFTLF